MIIVGGSYSGLSAAMSLGRSLRRVLVIDSGQPCNRQTPHSHNFLTHDGKAPGEIAALGREQVEKYGTVRFHEGLAVQGSKTETGFEIITSAGTAFSARKLVFASGVKDLMPDIPGFSDCWGISVIHCPYCHGYEVRGQKTGLFGNGDSGFELVKLISHWTDELALFTNGRPALTGAQETKIKKLGVDIVETPIRGIVHSGGRMRELALEDGSSVALAALYARVPVAQHCDIPLQLGCELTQNGLIKVDILQRTSASGVFAVGDNSSPLRSVSSAVAAGTVAGAGVNHELIDEDF